MKTVISLLTDFGVDDPFVGEMKAVIYSICPEARVIDLTHGVERYGIRIGAFLLAKATPYFPQGSVHVAVVDPGVGSERRAIAVHGNRSIYVGPDNGLLIPAAKREGIQHVYELTNRSLMRDSVSVTFHGRDVFAPVAAHLACGTLPNEVGGEVTDYVQLSFNEPKFHKKETTCEVLHIDRFGNIVTNISQEHLGRLDVKAGFAVRFRGRRFRGRLVKTYSELGGKEFGLLVGSHGFLEIACREASASQRLRARTGDVLRVVVD